MSNPKSPLPLGLGLPLAPLYAVAVARRNKRFDKGTGVRTPAIPVISVGNITVGGTGKTPHVQHIARTLRALGKRPAIALRGYGPKVAGMSDEHAEHRTRNPETPVAAHPNRYEAVAQLLTNAIPKPDVVILDDGFQHRKLRRNLDLVLVDATRSPFLDKLLPAGWLREPVSSLARASAVIVTHADIPSPSQLSALCNSIQRITGIPPIATTRHAWARDIPALIDSRETTKDTGWLQGKKIVLTCAIGNPDAFIRQARAAGANVTESITFRDHAKLRDKDTTRIIEAAKRTNADAILTTGKDWSKLKHIKPDRWPCPVLRPQVDIDFLTGRDELTTLIATALGPEKTEQNSE